jgi:hypothetical protein
MTEARCDCTGSPPWPARGHLHAGGPNRYYLCPECGAVREDVYQGEVTEHACNTHARDSVELSVTDSPTGMAASH